MNSRLIIKLHTRSDDEDHDISGICTGVVMSQTCNSADGRVEFDMLDTPDVNCRFGDVVMLILDTEVVFVGKLFAISRSSDIYLRHYTFYDETFYLRNAITMPVPCKVGMLTLVQALLDKYEIYYSRIDSAGEIVNERKIQNVSILDAVMDVINYVSYMYDKMYVFRPNAGAVEFVDIESSNVAGFQNSYPLVIDFSNEEEIQTQTYNYFEFYKKDDEKKPSKETKGKGGSRAKATQSDGSGDKVVENKPTNGTSKSKSKTVKKYLEPLVPYEQQAINLEIAMYAVGGVNSAQAQDLLAGKPELIKDFDNVPDGYEVGAKGYKLTGEVALWGYLPFLKEVDEIPPETVIDHMINIYRNPVRKATFTVLVHGDFHLAGDKLFIGEKEENASVYVINSVTTRFTNEEVIQELDIFSWQKTFEVQKLILAEYIKTLENTGGLQAVKSFAAQNNIDLIYKESEGLNDAGYVVTDKIWAQWKAEHGENTEALYDFYDYKLSQLDKLAVAINK